MDAVVLVILWGGSAVRILTLLVGPVINRTSRQVFTVGVLLVSTAFTIRTLDHRFSFPGGLTDLLWRECFALAGGFVFAYLFIQRTGSARGVWRSVPILFTVAVVVALPVAWSYTPLPTVRLGDLIEAGPRTPASLRIYVLIAEAQGIAWTSAIALRSWPLALRAWRTHRGGRLIALGHVLMAAGAASAAANGAITAARAAASPVLSEHCQMTLLTASDYAGDLAALLVSVGFSIPVAVTFRAAAAATRTLRPLWDELTRAHAHLGLEPAANDGNPSWLPSFSQLARFRRDLWDALSVIVLTPEAATTVVTSSDPEAALGALIKEHRWTIVDTHPGDQAFVARDLLDPPDSKAAADRQLLRIAAAFSGTPSPVTR